MLVQIEEVKRAIRALPFVTKLSPVRAHNGHGAGWGVSLRCFACEEYGSCGKKQEPPVQVSSRHPTELACLKELLKRLQDRHVECAEAVAKKGAADAASAAAVSPDAPNVLQAMMQLEQAKTRAKAANKLALEAEKKKDAAEQAVEELKQQLQPKRARTHDDEGHHAVMLFFSVSRCGQALCVKTIQLLVQGVLACARARSWIPVEHIRSVGARLDAY